MESFDYRKYIPLGLITLVLLLPVIVLLFRSGEDAEVRTAGPETDTQQTDTQQTDSRSGDADNEPEPAVDYAETGVNPALIGVIGLTPRPSASHHRRTRSR